MVRGEETRDVEATKDSTEDEISRGDVGEGVVRGTSTGKRSRRLPKEGKGDRNSLSCGGCELPSKTLNGGGWKEEEAVDFTSRFRVLDEVEEEIVWSDSG